MWYIDFIPPLNQFTAFNISGIPDQPFLFNEPFWRHSLHWAPAEFFNELKTLKQTTGSPKNKNIILFKCLRYLKLISKWGEARKQPGRGSSHYIFITVDKLLQIMCYTSLWQSKEYTDRDSNRHPQDCSDLWN